MDRPESNLRAFGFCARPRMTIARVVDASRGTYVALPNLAIAPSNGSGLRGQGTVGRPPYHVGFRPVRRACDGSTSSGRITPRQCVTRGRNDAAGIVPALAVASLNAII